MSSSKQKRVTLESGDREVFEVDENVVAMLKTVKHFLECEHDNVAIPIPSVKSEILGKVVEYCNQRASQVKGPAKSKMEIEEWEKEFIDVDHVTLRDLLLAANFLNIQGLLDLALDKTASMISGKYPQEIRDMFNIVNDSTPEEEIEIRTKNPWAFEGDPQYVPPVSDPEYQPQEKPLQQASDQTESQPQPWIGQTEPVNQEATRSESQPQR
ncbi:SKP1-like protein 1A [Aristolochia californica]|uniref:SKP1-like protein 1A n=1 Tax=Aristolochia californica TaxID=171875 RepID=UPI0035E15378